MLAERNQYLTFDESDLSVRTELKYNTESPTDIPVIVPQQRSTKDWGVAKGTARGQCCRYAVILDQRWKADLKICAFKATKQFLQKP